MKFSIGYNEKTGFLDLLEERNNDIHSVYFPLPKDLGSSGRPSRQNGKNYYQDSVNLVNTCKRLSIKPILLMNSTDSKELFDKLKLQKVIEYISALEKEGLEIISITNMLYLKILKKRFPNLKFYSSVNTRLKTVEQAIYFQKLGIDILTLDRDINRNLELIKKIKNRTGLEIQLMLNEPCLKNCPFRADHFNAVANDSEQIFGVEFEDLTCYPMIKDNNRLFFRIPFVRPEDLKYYDGIVDIYKLVTRDASNEKINFLLDIYKKQEHNGNLIDIFDLEPSQYLSKLKIDNSKLSKLNFLNKIKHCPGDCDTCNLCDIFL